VSNDVAHPTVYLAERINQPALEVYPAAKEEPWERRERQGIAPSVVLISISLRMIYVAVATVMPMAILVAVMLRIAAALMTVIVTITMPVAMLVTVLVAMPVTVSVAMFVVAPVTIMPVVSLIVMAVLLTIMAATIVITLSQCNGTGQHQKTKGKYLS